MSGSTFSSIPTAPPVIVRSAKLSALRVNNKVVSPYQQHYFSANASCNIDFSVNSTVNYSYAQRPVSYISASGTGRLNVYDMLTAELFSFNASFAQCSLTVNGGTIKNVWNVNAIIVCNGSTASSTNMITTLA